MMWFRAYVLTFSLALTGCTPLDPVFTFLAGETPQEEGTVLQTTFYGNNANSAVQQFIVARTQAEWQNLWKILQQEQSGTLPKGKMAVAILLGERPTGGYRVEVIAAERQSKLGDVDRLQVKWRQFAPSADAMITQAITSPWTVRIIDSWSNDPEFSEQSVIILRR